MILMLVYDFLKKQLFLGSKLGKENKDRVLYLPKIQLELAFLLSYIKMKKNYYKNHIKNIYK